MASRFNTLYRGSAHEAAEILEMESDVSRESTTVDELRIALINALRRIEVLEGQMRLSENL